MSIFTKAMLWLFGLLLVPMDFAFTGLMMLHGKTLVDTLPVLLMYGGAYAAVGATFHYLQSSETHPLSCIVYFVSTTESMSDKEFMDATSGRLHEVLSHVSWHGSPSAVVETADRSATVAVPIYLAIEKWSDSETLALLTYLAAIEREWEEKGFKYSRSDSPSLRTRIENSDAMQVNP